MEDISVLSTAQSDSNTLADSFEQLKTNEPDQHQKLLELYKKGSEAAQNTNYRVAIANFTEALDIFPEHYVILNQRGICY